MVLAINSDRTEKLQNTTAGAALPSTWRERVKIRETELGHLGFVVDDKMVISFFSTTSRALGWKIIAGPVLRVQQNSQGWFLVIEPCRGSRARSFLTYV